MDAGRKNQKDVFYSSICRYAVAWAVHSPDAAVAILNWPLCFKTKHMSQIRLLEGGGIASNRKMVREAGGIASRG